MQSRLDLIIIHTHIKLSPQWPVVGHHQARLLVVISEQHLIEVYYTELAGELLRKMSLKPDVVVQPIFD